ncbi:hypothetical protein [Cereibacter azotoformans]|uniref:Lipoprotein n=1 Tax=Cereibacter azotoformans TaxID=43057 RepID=A0A2T5JTP9_9RHOB|nr:hypothetical protein [Cereibacter azotoformans]PTR13418.1 hypothetical protein C8J28_12248 [Cereibacter azotoformans]
MTRTVLLSALGFLLGSCGTPEFRAEKDSCTADWMTRIPPRHEQEMYNQVQSRQVPTGTTTCTGVGYTVTCHQVMRTEYYTVPAVRTVDRNEPLRDLQIRQCTQQACIAKYGNAECEKPG